MCQGRETALMRYRVRGKEKLKEHDGFLSKESLDSPFGSTLRGMYLYDDFPVLSLKKKTKKQNLNNNQ